MKSKYRAIPTMIDNIRFASKKEAGRYCYLKWMLKVGRIRNLQIQPELEFWIDDKPIFKYRADFSYFEGAQPVWEDVKGVRTPLYKLKKKIIEAHYKIQIRET